MKIWIKRIIVFVLIFTLLPWPFGWHMERVSAAGEVIEYNEYNIPVRNYVQSRPASYAGDPNWYPSTMYADFLGNSFKVTWDQVQDLLTLDISNSYLPTRWEMYREELGQQPKDFSHQRYYHGYYTEWSQSLEVVYKDGSIDILSGLSTGWGGSMFSNGNLSGYENNLTNTFNSIVNQDMGAPEIVYWPGAPPYTNPYSRKPIVPHSAYLLPNYNKSVPAYLKLTVNLSELYGINTGFARGTAHHTYTISDVITIPLTTNKKPNLTLTSQAGQNIINDAGLSTYHLEGYVQDPDNDTVDVIAEIPNVFYKKITLANTGSPKNFSIPIDVMSEGIPPGHYTVNVKVVDPFNMKAEASTSFSVTNRLRNKAFYLINTQIDIGTSYADYENDPKSADRFRYDHDPSIFDNTMGMIWDSGLWRNSMYTSFPYSGAYTATHQARDNPNYDDRFDPYRLWSRDNLSSMTFMIHRKPFALFTAKLVNGSLQLTDSSYDLDHVSSPTKGLATWQWQYRASGQETWIEGQPPAQLPTNDAYEIRLRVRDIDGPSGLGVWSDWTNQTVGSPSNLPPVAMFMVDHNSVSYRKSATITDKSFDPDNDPLDIYSWSVVKDGWNTVWSSYGGPTVPPNIAAFGVGNYQINLQVHDNRGLWSNVYTQFVQVINHPPIASFTMPNEVYRDTVIKPNNLTPDPDQDGDGLTYGWYTKLNAGNYYWTGSNRDQSVTIKNMLSQSGISDKEAISDGWEMRLNVSDGSLTSYATQMFTVKNHVPAASISGDSSAYQYDTKTYRSADFDEDTSDQASLRYYWRVTDSSSRISLYQTKDINIIFDDFGVYTLEHWAVDQIDDKSNIATLKVSVTQNQAPSMTLTAPIGTVASPTIIDAQLAGDPLVQWTYSDPENDPQEKYRLEFYGSDGDLVKTVENADPSGFLRQYQVPNLTFERFKYFTVYGRAYAKLSWSQISNEKTFIIDNPPQPGFTLVTDRGVNAALEPIYRTDILNIKGTATDADIVNGDSLSYKYYLKPAGGTEGLASAQSDFSKQFATNGAFTLRQVVTDSLGLYRELSQTITVINRIPKVNISYPTSTSSSSPTVVSTLTPIIKWDFGDDDGDLQQRYRVRIINLATGAIKVQSGDQASSAKQWQVPAGALIENEKYAVEVDVYDGFDWSAVSQRKYFMVNLLTVQGAVRHTPEWNANRQAYNVKKSGTAESPRGYSVFWAGESFVLQANATGLPDSIEVTMTGGYHTLLIPADSSKTSWDGELYDSSFERLPDGPVTFTFTAKNAFNKKTDTVTVTIQGDWQEYFQSHRIK